MTRSASGGETWVTPLAVLDDVALVDQIKRVYVAINQDWFDEPAIGVNQHLPIRVGEVHRVEFWRVTLLLTPWMLAKIFVPGRAPAIALPRGWSAKERRDAPYAVIGPAVSLPIPGAGGRAHVNYHPDLGHHLVQPLIQSMERFDSTEAVDAAWNEVVKTCRENMQARTQATVAQQAVSRRQFFSRIRTLGS